MRASTAALRISSTRLCVSCIRAQSHVDLGAQTVAEILHYLAIACERRRAMRDRRAAVGDQCKAGLGAPADPGMRYREIMHGRGSFPGQVRRSRAPAHWTGVLRWRRIISCASTTLWAMCTVKGMPWSRVAFRLSRTSSSVQFSICIGETTPDNRPLGCRAASSISASAAAKPAWPRASSQANLSSKSFSGCQRAVA